MSFEPGIWLWDHHRWWIRLNPLHSLLKNHCDGHHSSRHYHYHRLHQFHSPSSALRRFSALPLYTIYLTIATKKRRVHSYSFGFLQFDISLRWIESKNWINYIWVNLVAIVLVPLSFQIVLAMYITCIICVREKQMKNYPIEWEKINKILSSHILNKKLSMSSCTVTVQCIALFKKKLSALLTYRQITAHTRLQGWKKSESENKETTRRNRKFVFCRVTRSHTASWVLDRKTRENGEYIMWNVDDDDDVSMLISCDIPTSSSINKNGCLWLDGSSFFFMFWWCKRGWEREEILYASLSNNKSVYFKNEIGKPCSSEIAENSEL